MARLQRKKTSSTKKKKKQNAAGAISSRSKNDVDVKKTTLFTGPAGEIKKRPYSSQTKALTKTRTEPGKVKSYINKGIQFLREVKVELKKVVWPTRKQTLSSTIVVIILTVIIACFLGMADLGLSSLIRVVLH
ncbi:MAG: preprotein translocase subunit SecE [Deltaproteobacteria bacterium]|nr:preprotein translocase subunit SecE [Deltaproteobacteria bacterium]MBW2013439.1 preprotein translocase subunit SecE [Deltaproteobacteria bacterium]MBW2088830.1 preprotein translocase subunit SecE [Deltaproteobacteria bacterium]MBW2319589.1 preprotein translocase subunit SecE [Deltaproteobacteria bacterium]